MTLRVYYGPWQVPADWDDVRHSANFGLRRTPGCTGAAGRGRRDHSPLSLTVMDCHSLGMHTVILLSLIP